MKKLRIRGNYYFCSECEAEDRLFKNILEPMEHGVEMNFTSSPHIIPTISGYKALRTVGKERGAIDDWGDSDLKLLRKLHGMPQHFRLMPRVCLTRENFRPTDLWTVYIKGESKKCECEYCTKGMNALLGE